MKNRIDKERLNVETPYITFVWAEDNNGLIGKDNDLPWVLPGEMKFFVEATRGGVVIMGRKTYEGIPNPPLKDRINIVLTRNKDFQAEGTIVCHSKEEIMKYLEKEKINLPIHIIGGTALFEMFMDEVSVLYRTVIDEVFEGDTYMPEMDYEKFQCVYSVDGTIDEENKHAHRLYLYQRKKPITLFK